MEQKLAYQDGAEPKVRQKVVVMTGATRGLGRAMAERILQENPGIKIVNIGRSSRDDVRSKLESSGETELFSNVYEGSRINFIPEVDLADEEKLNAAISGVLSDTNIQIQAVIHCAGEAVLCENYETADEQTRTKVEHMRKVNCDAGVTMVKRLLAAGQLNSETPVIMVGSLGAVAGRCAVPQLEEYKNTKDNATAQLHELVDELGVPLLVACPRAFKTDMVDGFINEDGCALEFSGVPLGHAGTEDPIIEAIAKAVSAQGEMGENKEILGNTIPALYVKYLNIPAIRQFALPFFLWLFGNSVLEDAGQTPEQHRRRVEFHEQNNSYQPQLKGIERLKDTKNLAPAWVGNLLEKVMRKLRLI